MNILGLSYWINEENFSDKLSLLININEVFLIFVAFVLFVIFENPTEIKDINKLFHLQIRKIVNRYYYPGIDGEIEIINLMQEQHHAEISQLEGELKKIEEKKANSN